MTLVFSEPFTQHSAERSGHIWIHAEPSQPEWNLTPEAAAWMATASSASHGPVCHVILRLRLRLSHLSWWTPSRFFFFFKFTAEFAAGSIGLIPFILGSDGEMYLLSAVCVRRGCQAWAKPKEVQSNYTNPRCPSLSASELRNRFEDFIDEFFGAYLRSLPGTQAVEFSVWGSQGRTVKLVSAVIFNNISPL